MSSQTFKARVALGSWINTPLMAAGLPTTILTESLKKSERLVKLVSDKGKGKSRAEAPISVDSAPGSDIDLYD
jgi:hypothetical protein